MATHLVPLISPAVIPNHKAKTASDHCWISKDKTKQKTTRKQTDKTLNNFLINAMSMIYIFESSYYKEKQRFA